MHKLSGKPILMLGYPQGEKVFVGEQQEQGCSITNNELGGEGDYSPGNALNNQRVVPQGWWVAWVEQGSDDKFYRQSQTSPRFRALHYILLYPRIFQAGKTYNIMFHCS